MSVMQETCRMNAPLTSQHLARSRDLGDLPCLVMVGEGVRSGDY